MFYMLLAIIYAENLIFMVSAGYHEPHNRAVHLHEHTLSCSFFVKFKSITYQESTITIGAF